MTKQIKNHQLFNINDYQERSERGYSDKEIISIWNRDLGLGHTKPNTRKDLNLPNDNIFFKNYK